MSTERPRHSHEMHFDELLAGRVVTEAMTEFDADTPIEDVLRWLHERLSLVEEGFHVVKGFSASAEYFQPTFTVDAVKLEEFPETFKMDARFPVTPVDPKFIPMNAWFTGAGDLDAYVKGIRPNQYYHYDTFSNEQLHGWGWADTIGSYEYTTNIDEHTSTQGFEWAHRKVDVDTTPPSEDPEGEPSNDFRGQYIEDLPWPHGSSPQVLGQTILGDRAVANKRILFLASFGNATGTGGMDQRIYFRGGNNYLLRGSSVSNSSLYLYVDGTQRGSNLGSTNGFYWFKIEAQGRFVRVKKWAEGASEPSTWAIEVDNATPTPGPTKFDYNGKYGGIIVPELQGSPWTHQFKFLSVEGINTGPIPANAYLRPAPFSASAWLSSGDDFVVSSFILPTFRANALLVNYIPGHFTIGAFKEGRWEVDVTADAFKQPYFRAAAVINDDAVMGSHTADAWKVITNADDMYVDADVKDVDRTFSVTADGIVKDIGIPDDFSAAAYKNLLITGDVDVDAYLGPGAHPPFDAVIKRPDQSGSYKADAVLWPEGIEHYEINAVQKVIDQYSGTLGTVDSTFVDIGRDHIAHWDDFNRSVVYAPGGWANPSSETAGQDPKGLYYYRDASGNLLADSEMWRFTVDGDVGAFYEKNQYYSVHTEKIANDREMYMEFRHQDDNLVSGHWRIGIHGDDWAPLASDQIHIRMKQAAGTQTQELWVNGVQRDTWSLNGTNQYIAMRARLIDDQLWWKIWVRDSESEPAYRHVDMSSYWTPQDGYTFWYCQSGNYFGTKGPWTQRIDVWRVESLGGYPERINADAVIKRLDQEHAHTVDGYLVPQPFSMDAFIEPWFSMSARIWLGTTFPADAVKREEIVFGGNEMIPGGSVGTNGGSTYWQYNSSAAPIAAEQARVSGGTINQQGSIKSKETFGPTSGNAFPSVANRTWTFYHSASPRDTLRAGLYDATLGTGHDYTGFYGFIISDYSNVIQDLINGSGGGSSSWSDDISSITKFEFVYEDAGGGNSRMYCYVDGVLRRTSATFATPTWASFRMGFFTQYGIITGGDWIWYTPQIGSWRDPGTADAWIVSGDHIPFNAFLTGKHLDAIIKVPDNIGGWTIDMVKHVLGEQLKSFTSDAWAAAYVQRLDRTQFGWLDLGQMLWGDVRPEYEQIRFRIGAWLAGIMGVDAFIDLGHFWANANVIMDDRLWYYENHDDGKPDEGRTENMRIWMWDNLT